MPGAGIDSNHARMSLLLFALAHCRCAVDPENPNGSGFAPRTAPALWSRFAEFMQLIATMVVGVPDRRRYNDNDHVTGTIGNLSRPICVVRQVR